MMFGFDIGVSDFRSVQHIFALPVAGVFKAFRWQESFSVFLPVAGVYSVFLPVAGVFCVSSKWLGVFRLSF